MMTRGVSFLASLANRVGLTTSTQGTPLLLARHHPQLLVITLRAAIEAIVPVAEAKGVQLTIDLAPGVGILQADADRLRQVVWNLLTNAVKFTPPQGKVSVTTRRIGSEAEIRVGDTGRGISPEFLPHVFERFSQADSASTRTQGGMGLGLAIAKQLVELHSGKITAESAGQGQGATFIVRLPLAKGSTAQSPVSRASGRKHEAPDFSRLQGVRTLLVEDDAMTRQAIANVLRKAGLQVFEANSANAALKAFEQHAPQLIVSDIGMPDKDGYTLLKEIRESEAKRGKAPVPAVALTAFARDSDRSRAIAAGFQEHVAKPVDADQVVDVLYDILLLRRS